MATKLSSIFYADDDPDDHFIVETALKEINPSLKLSSFYHCDEMINHLEKDEIALPDLILLDYNMPGNDGNACLLELKKRARFYHIPVVMYSTSEENYTIAKTPPGILYKYLVKPTSYEGIKDIFQQLLADFEAN